MEVWQVIYKGDLAFEGSRAAASEFMLWHGLSRYYRGKRLLNLGVELKRVETDNKADTERRPDVG